MIALFLAAAAAVASPADDESLTLARQIASQGLLATIAPLQTGQEIEALIADHPELTPDQVEQLREIGDRKAAELVDRAIEADARAITAQLSIEDLRAIAEFSASPASRHQREAMPAIIMATMQTLGSVDYKGDVIEEFCSETQLLCAE